MANELDELTGPAADAGNDVKVIAKQLPVTIGTGSKVFDFIWWFLPPLIGGLIWWIIKVKAKAKLQQIQQKLQHDASQIDNYLEQRVQILKNCAKLVDKAIAFDKETFTQIAALRATGTSDTDASRIETAERVEALGKAVNIAFEN